MDQTHLMTIPSYLPLLHTHTCSYFPSFSPAHNSLSISRNLTAMFDPRKQPSNNHIHILDPITTLNDSYKSCEPLNFGFQISEKLGNWTKKDGGGMQFRVPKMEDHDDGVESGASSPPLWQNSPPRSPVQPINYRSLSPSSRTQEIARGQRELMEMVKYMPESCYELSLKDIVEQQPRVLESQEESLIKNRVKIKRQESSNNKAKMMRSKSFENGGVYLKMVSPVSLTSNNKKKNSAKITKVSPKPEEFENSSKSLEKDWWKKRFSSSSSGSCRASSNSRSTGRSGSTGSSSCSSTNSRNNSSNRKRKGFLTSCWSKLCFSKSISSG